MELFIQMNDEGLSEIESLIACGDFSLARTLCEKLCSDSCEDARPWFLLGAIYGQQNSVVQAERCMRRALSLDPRMGAAHYNLAILLLRQQKPLEAESCLRRAKEFRPSDAAIYNELGNVLAMQDRIKEAVLAYRKAIQLRPGFRDALFNLGTLFLDMDDLHSALGCFRSAYDCDHSFIKAKAMEAIILEKQGNIGDAFHCLEPWLGREDIDPAIANAFAAVSLHLGKESEAINCLKKVIQSGQCENDNRSGLYFRLGALQERLKKYDAAFETYSKANELEAVPDNAETFILDLKRSRQIFTKEAIDSVPRAAQNGAGLIFIVGMPRSGTSLIEQMLSVHSQVLAGGELALLARLAEDIFMNLSEGKASSAIDITGLTQESVAHYAYRYQQTMRANIGVAERLTDKTPHNFRYLGLIDMLFPKARIIHCTRSPLDTCVSCYCNQFSGENLAYSSNLTSLGHVYREYFGLMAYWKDALSIPVLDVSYEAVVDDAEQWARRVLEFCGLEWEAECLNFHEAKRQVHTASYNQVRQPVYKSAVNRWMNYERYLGPLKAALGDLVVQG